MRKINLKEKRISEIRALYIAMYPHLSGIKNERQFFLNATRYMTPAGVSMSELYRIITDLEL